MAEAFERFLLECTPMSDGTYMIKEARSRTTVIAETRELARTQMIAALGRWMAQGEVPVRSTEEIFLRRP